ncbi:MAG: P-loop NTPase fold protein, partial [Eubacterium sp.]|nr:P-loop NTPase fold protein [Eubacterium sp.]
MEQTELFDFSFVDREREQQIFKNFMSNADKKILWISGDRGVGKSEFITYMTATYEKYSFVYYDVKENCRNEDILTDFIQKLQQMGNFSFCEFVQKEYKKFYDTLGTTTKAITHSLNPSISEVVSVILDVTSYVITKNEERRENIDIIKKYIDKILSAKSLFICIDNFSRCNEDIVKLLCNIFKSFLTYEKCKICIITTDDDMNDEKELKIREQIAYTGIKIEKFKKHIYFWQIMEPIFEMDDFSDNDIKYIYSKCSGKPHNLSIIISKLLDKQGIICSTKKEKATINKRILQDVLKEKHIKYGEADFTYTQKLIIFSFLCLFEGVDIQIVEELSIYIANKNYLYNGFTKDRFRQDLLELISCNKLSSDGITLSTCHDSDYIDYMDIFRTSQIYKIISQNAYEFLLYHETLKEREDLICHHMREAKIESWEERNFLYGKKLFVSHNYFDSEKIFSYLLSETESLDEYKLLVIAINEYQVGHFNIAIKVLEAIDIEKLENTSQKYFLLFYWGKSIYNYTGDTSIAISKLIEATKYVSDSSAEYVNVQNILQMLYFEVPGKYDEALKIFNNIRDNYKVSQPNAWANTMRGCHNYIQNSEEALDLLEEAQSCISDDLERAYIDTTKGFIYIKKGNIDKAKDCFNSSYESIKKMKVHESSYAINDLAVCYMMEGDYLSAKKLLLDGLFWNKTNYGKIVLYVHLMLCEAFLGNNMEAEKYFDFLIDYIANPKIQDLIMLRKVLLNLAVACKELKKNIEYEIYIKKAEKYIHNTSSEWRYLAIQGINNTQIPDNIYYSYSKFDPWFIVY